MARLVDEDFGRLKLYIESYSLSGSLTSHPREQLIRRAHKHSLAALQMWAIATHLSETGSLVVHQVQMVKNSPQYEQLSEAFSVSSRVAFRVPARTPQACLHGVTQRNRDLRSESRGASSAEAMTTTSVYRLFELASAASPFTGQGKIYFDTLHQQYGELSGHTHSATNAHMVKNHAMSTFPKLESEHLREWVRRNQAITVALLSILTFSNRALYLAASPKAQDVYEEVMPKPPRLFALGAPV